MARASFFLTRTDADSIARRQLKNGASSLVFLLLVDAAAAFWLYFTREGGIVRVPELSHLTTAARSRGHGRPPRARRWCASCCTRARASLAVSLGQAAQQGPAAAHARWGCRVGSAAFLGLRAPPRPPNLRPRRTTSPSAPGPRRERRRLVEADPASRGVRVGDAPPDASTIDPRAVRAEPRGSAVQQRARRRDGTSSSRHVSVLRRHAGVRRGQVRGVLLRRARPANRSPCSASHRVRQRRERRTSGAGRQRAPSAPGCSAGLSRARAAVPRPRRGARLRHVRLASDRGEQGSAVRRVPVQDVRLRLLHALLLAEESRHRRGRHPRRPRDEGDWSARRRSTSGASWRLRSSSGPCSRSRSSPRS